MKTIYIRPGWRCNLDFTGKSEGDEAPLDGLVEVSVIDGATLVADLARLGDRQFRFVAAENEGTVLLEATADADPNSGEENENLISSQFQIVIAEEADSICVAASAFASGPVE